MEVNYTVFIWQELNETKNFNNPWYTGSGSSCQVFRVGKATHRYQSAIAFLSLRKFLQNYAFCDVTKLRNPGLPMVRSQTD